MTLPFERTVSAPCKLNLTLDVGSVRPDGFHSLHSLAVRLSPDDEVTVTVRPGTRQVKLLVKDKRPDAVADVPIPRGNENIAHRAAQIARDALVPDADVDVWIRLVKRLPAQAGLGGGSTDAAAVLRILGDLWGAPDDKIQTMGASLGSDVPLFLNPGENTVLQLSGRGEVALPLAAIAPLWGVLVRPAIGVSTAPAYSLLDASPRTERGATAALEAALKSQPLTPDGLAPLLWNDFEAPILDAYPEIGEAHAAIGEAGSLRALLCGSGSTVWGLARDREHAVHLVRQLVGRFPWVKLAVTV